MFFFLSLRSTTSAVIKTGFFSRARVPRGQILLILPHNNNNNMYKHTSPIPLPLPLALLSATTYNALFDTCPQPSPHSLFFLQHTPPLFTQEIPNVPSPARLNPHSIHTYIPSPVLQFLTPIYKSATKQCPNRARNNTIFGRVPHDVQDSNRIMLFWRTPWSLMKTDTQLDS